MNPKPITTLLTALAASLSVSGARAETVGSYTDLFNYDYRVFGMPDLDQVRGAGPGAFQLPGSGYMYCAPTSTFNMAAYIANHGFPELTDIGAQNWQSASLYNSAGLGILNMGNFMGTHPTDGTGGFGFHDGAREYVNARSNAFTVTHQYANNNFAPHQALLTHVAVCGSLVSFGYGRYNVIGAFEGVPIIDRDGGHVVTLSRSTRGNGGERRLWVRDPADEQTNLTAQLTFTDRQYGLLHDRVVMTGLTLNTLKVMTEIGVGAGAPGTSNRYIDGYIAIRPKMGYALTDDSTVVSFVVQGLVGSFPVPPQMNFDLGAQVHDVIMNPDMTGLIVTLDENAESPIVCIDAATGAVKDLSAELGVLAPDRVFFGRNRQFYVIDDDTLKCFNLDIDPPVLEASVVPPAPIVGMTFNDDTDELVCLSATEQVLMTYPADLAGDGSVMPLPGAVNLFDDASIAFNPGEGTILFHPGGGQNLVYQATRGARGDADYAVSSIGLQGVVDPSHVEADDSGMFYVMGENGLQGYARGEDGRFGPAADALFNGVVSDGLFRLTHGRVNDSEIPVEEQYNIHPDELMKGGSVAECAMDLTDDGKVDSRDLAALLANWDQIGVRADLDGNGVDARDLAALLAAWGACFE